MLCIYRGWRGSRGREQECELVGKISALLLFSVLFFYFSFQNWTYMLRLTLI